MNRSAQALFVILGLAWPGAVAFAQSPAQPSWDPIDTALTQLAKGDAKSARASLWKARKTDESGLAELVLDLTEAYVAYNSPNSLGAYARFHDTNEALDSANQYYYHRHIPPEVLGDALTRIRRHLKEAPSSAPGLRPLLCNLRLLARDHSTNGEPVLEASGKSDDMGSLIPPRPVLAPPPPFTGAATGFRTGGEVIVELFLDSEGCPSSEKLLKPLPYGLAEQTLATLKWWAFEPAEYEGHAVAWKHHLTVRFVAY